MTFKEILEYSIKGARELDQAVHEICRSHGSGGFRDVNAPPVKIIKTGTGWSVKKEGE